MAGVERGALDVGIDQLQRSSLVREGFLAHRAMEALERISGNRPVVLRPRGQQAGPRRLLLSTSRPSVRCGAKPKSGEAGQVGGRGEQVEIGVYFRPTTYTSAPPAVTAAHEVAKFAFDLWAGGPVISSPSRVFLTVPGAGQNRGSASSDHYFAHRSQWCTGLVAGSWRTTGRTMRCRPRPGHGGC